MVDDPLALFAVLVSVVVAVQALLAGLTTVWVNRHIDLRAESRDKALDAKAESRNKALDAKVEGIARTLDAKIEGIGKTLDAKIACVQEAVATGAEEHKAWRAELDNTNKRLDDLLMHLMGRDSAK